MKRFILFFCSGVFLFSACSISNSMPVFKQTEDSKKLTKAYNHTGFDIFKELKTEKGNLVISPYSINTALTMALLGAKGETHTEMAKVMHQN